MHDGCGSWGRDPGKGHQPVRADQKAAQSYQIQETVSNQFIVADELQDRNQALI